MNSKLIFVLSAILAILSYSKLRQDVNLHNPIPHHVTQMFQEWLIRHEKSHERPEELLHRLRIFYENYKYVTEANKANNGLILGMTMFADLHTDEFSAGSKNISLPDQDFEDKKDTKVKNGLIDTHFSSKEEK
jgi:Cathepsin propeptide inhibitor domain (I29)